MTRAMQQKKQQRQPGSHPLASARRVDGCSSIRPTLFRTASGSPNHSSCSKEAKRGMRINQQQPSTSKRWRRQQVARHRGRQTTPPADEQAVYGKRDGKLAKALWALRWAANHFCGARAASSMKVKPPEAAVSGPCPPFIRDSRTNQTAWCFMPQLKLANVPLVEAQRTR